MLPPPDRPRGSNGGGGESLDPHATSTPTPADDAAKLPGDAGAAAEGAPSSDQTTTASPAGQQDDDPVAKLTPEQRARILRDADPDEYAQVNDRFNGYVGKKLQVKAAEDAERARKQELLGLRDRAVREGDPDAALQYTKATTEAELEESHASAWSQAVDVFTRLDADPLTKPIVNGLAGRDYGKLAGGNGTLAALLYKADLASGVIDHLPKWQAEMTEKIRTQLERELRPAMERELRARLLGEEPPPDTGTGAAPTESGLPRTLSATRQYIARMSGAEYARREAELDRHVASFRRGAPTR